MAPKNSRAAPPGGAASRAASAGGHHGGPRRAKRCSHPDSPGSGSDPTLCLVAAQMTATKKISDALFPRGFEVASPRRSLEPPRKPCWRYFESKKVTTRLQSGEAATAGEEGVNRNVARQSSRAAPAGVHHGGPRGAHAGISDDLNLKISSPRRSLQQARRSGTAAAAQQQRWKHKYKQTNGE